MQPESLKYNVIIYGLRITLPLPTGLWYHTIPYRPSMAGKVRGIKKKRKERRLRERTSIGTSTYVLII
jgi:hypothetical protein